MEPSSIKVHSVETISIFWTWWWSACPSSPLEYSECNIMISDACFPPLSHSNRRLELICRFSISIKMLRTCTDNIIWQQFQATSPVKLTILSNVHLYYYMINVGLVSQIMTSARETSPVQKKKRKSSWKAAKWGNVFI